MGSNKYTYSEKHLRDAVLSTSSLKECTQKLGLSIGSNTNVRKRIDKLGISTSHWRQTARGAPRRLLEYIVNNPTMKCVFWPFADDGKGYALISIEGKSCRAYRIVWEMYYKKDFPHNLVARHLCGKGQHGCVNPLHIIPGTHKENRQDNMKDFCNNGHEYSEDNLYTAPSVNYRLCKTCLKNRQRRYYNSKMLDEEAVDLEEEETVSV
jgi:hypothetical protein